MKYGSRYKQGAHEWVDQLNWRSTNCTTISFSDKIRRLSLAVTVYHIWQPRNQAIFQHLRWDVQEIMQPNNRDIRFSVMNWRKVKRTGRNWELSVIWEVGVGPNIFY